MSAPAPRLNDRRPNAWLAILRAGLVAGVLDITAAIVVYAHVTHVVPLLQGIASGILGRDAFTGGPAAAPPGPLWHLLVPPSGPPGYFLANPPPTLPAPHPAD